MRTAREIGARDSIVNRFIAPLLSRSIRSATSKRGLGLHLLKRSMWLLRGNFFFLSVKPKLVSDEGKLK